MLTREDPAPLRSRAIRRLVRRSSTKPTPGKATPTHMNQSSALTWLLYTTYFPFTIHYCRTTLDPKYYALFYIQHITLICFHILYSALYTNYIHPIYIMQVLFIYSWQHSIYTARTLSRRPTCMHACLHVCMSVYLQVCNVM